MQVLFFITRHIPALMLYYCSTVEEKIMGTKQASFLLGISRQRLLVLLAQGRVKGAEKNRHIA